MALVVRLYLSFKRSSIGILFFYLFIVLVSIYVSLEFQYSRIILEMLIFML